MHYRITENYTDFKYELVISFDCDMYSFFSSPEAVYDISIYDSLKESSTIEITDFASLLNYGISTSSTETTPEGRMNDSLVKNGGLVISFDNNRTMRFTFISYCKGTDSGREIGFYFINMRMNVCLNDGSYSINAYGELFARIKREDNLIKANSGDADPILPEGIERSCYGYPEIYEDGKSILHNIGYYTENSIFMNTSAKEASENMVPLYISKLSACYIDGEENIYSPNWDSIQSYICDPITNVSSINIEYEPTTLPEPVVVEEQVVSGDGEAFNTSVLTYSAIQYVYTDQPGTFKNELVFEIGSVTASE